MAINSEFFPLKMVIFHSYVSLPEGIVDIIRFKSKLFVKDFDLPIYRSKVP